MTLRQKSFRKYMNGETLTEDEMRSIIPVRGGANSIVSASERHIEIVYKDRDGFWDCLTFSPEEIIGYNQSQMVEELFELDADDVPY